MPAYSIDDEVIVAWRPTTLREQHKNEEYLERLIAADPLILGLDPYVTGVGTKFAAFRQTRLESPNSRALRPDVVLLTETGHVVVVEVKLEDNLELRDRRVISQIVDYASAVANLDEQALVGWLGLDEDRSWTDVVRRAFPTAYDVDRLAGALRDRVARADIHLVIACDQAPPGIRETVGLISAQAALGEFELHFVELTPYVCDSQERLLVIPHEIARTQIVSRTAVTVTHDNQYGVGVTVVASSPAQVEEAMHQAESGRTIRPEFEAVLDAYDPGAPAGLRTNGHGLAYRQVSVAGWPGAVHYEFLDRRLRAENVGVEIHVESADYPEICALVQELAEELSFAHGSVQYSSKWFRGCRLSVIVPVREPAAAAETMRALIEATRDRIEAALSELDPSS